MNLIVNPGNLRGDQLRDEIEAATGVRLDRDEVSFIPPNTLVVPDAHAGHAEAMQAVIDAHVPNSEYTEADRAQTSAADAWATLQPQIANHLAALAVAFDGAAWGALTAGERDALLRRLAQGQTYIVRLLDHIMRK